MDEPLLTPADTQDLKVEPLRTLYESLPDEEEAYPQIDYQVIDPISNPAWYWLGEPHQFKRNAKNDSSSEESNESKSDSSKEKKLAPESSTLGVNKTRRNVDTSESDSKDSSEEAVTTAPKDRVQRDASGESSSSSMEANEKTEPRQRRSIGQLEKIAPEEKVGEYQ